MEIKEKPILFSTDMICAILENRKTVTRRVIKPQPINDNFEYYYNDNNLGWGIFDGKNHIKCPYQVGQQLWCRETWAYDENKMLSLGDTIKDYIIYKADIICKDSENPFKWKPSIFIPKKYCRIWLEVTNVRVERLQDISDEDCINEGIDPETNKDYNKAKHYQLDGSPIIQEWSPEKFAFMCLWNFINAKRGYSWVSNPWVYAIDFKKTN